MKFVLLGLGNMADNREIIEEAVIEADKLGFHLALMPDHYMWGTQVQHSFKRPFSTLETWTTLTYLAGKTEKIKLGTLVTPLTLRHPAILAKMLSTLDILSKGRVVLGIGAGWITVEFKGFSEWLGDKNRVDKTVEALRLMIDLWTKPEVTHDGKYYKINKAVLEPKPIQKPYPSLLFGSTGKRMLQLTGKYGSLCFIPPWISNNRETIKNIVMEAAEKNNRRHEIAFIEGLMGANRSYDSDEYMKIVESVRSSGASYCTVGFPPDTMINSMRKFSMEVMPSFS
jgi:alkanesulfonate monooxygenase SsuD/methylene tetrahydromethanopterin reductase-like flavin-dependent oxidoreductase (luciferase family)